MRIPLSPGKGARRIAILEWHTIRSRLKELASVNHRDLGDVRGVIREESGELLRGAPLGTILQTLPHLRLDEGVLRSWPEQWFDATTDHSSFIAAAELALRVVPRGKSSRRLGFLSLTSDGTRFRLEPRRGWRRALEETLSSLQSVPGNPPPLEKKLQELQAQISDH